MPPRPEGAEFETHPARAPSLDGRGQLQHEHGIGAQILSDVGLRTTRLLTNHPRRIVALEGFGIQVVEQAPLGR